jgi:hypothetical protein
MDYTSIRLGQLPTAAISMTDNFAHEVGTDLKRGTIQELSDFIANYASTISGVGFRNANVVSGQTLPNSTIKEFILVGKGTFFNINGGATLVTTEELNAIVSNGSTWSIGVAIPINSELIGIVQTIRSGFIATAPSENAIFNALALKLNVADSTPAPLLRIDYPKLTVANATFAIPVNGLCRQVYVNKLPWFEAGANNTYQVDTWTQIGANVILKQNAKVNNYVIIFYQ